MDCTTITDAATWAACMGEAVEPVYTAVMAIVAVAVGIAVLMAGGYVLKRAVWFTGE